MGQGVRGGNALNRPPFDHNRFRFEGSGKQKSKESRSICQARRSQICHAMHAAITSSKRLTTRDIAAAMATVTTMACSLFDAGCALNAPFLKIVPHQGVIGV